MTEDLRRQRNDLTQITANTDDRPDILIFPEAGIAKFEFRNLDNISQVARRKKRAMLVASPDMDATNLSYNSVFSNTSTGQIHKRHS